VAVTTKLRENLTRIPEQQAQLQEAIDDVTSGWTITTAKQNQNSPQDPLHSGSRRLASITRGLNISSGLGTALPGAKRGLASPEVRATQKLTKIDEDTDYEMTSIFIKASGVHAESDGAGGLLAVPDSLHPQRSPYTCANCQTHHWRCIHKEEDSTTIDRWLLRPRCRPCQEKMKDNQPLEPCVHAVNERALLANDEAFYAVDTQLFERCNNCTTVSETSLCPHDIASGEIDPIRKSFVNKFVRHPRESILDSKFCHWRLGKLFWKDKDIPQDRRDVENATTKPFTMFLDSKDEYCIPTLLNALEDLHVAASPTFLLIGLSASQYLATPVRILVPGQTPLRLAFINRIHLGAGVKYFQKVVLRMKLSDPTMSFGCEECGLLLKVQVQALQDHVKERSGLKFRFCCRACVMDGYEHDPNGIADSAEKFRSTATTGSNTSVTLPQGNLKDLVPFSSLSGQPLCCYRVPFSDPRGPLSKAVRQDEALQKFVEPVVSAEEAKTRPALDTV